MESSTGASASSSAQSDPETIRQVQEQLSQKGEHVSVDGKMGPQTRAALKKFQQKEGLQATGRLDQKTLAALGVDQSQSGAIGSTGRSGSASESMGSSPSSPSSSSPSPAEPSGSTGGSSQGSTSSPSDMGSGSSSQGGTSGGTSGGRY
jgi:peptidoglycan hydrolase-like protein with peptidoglycan-binding domain